MSKQQFKTSPAKIEQAFGRVPTIADRENVHLLFQNYVLRSQENLLKRLTILGWNHKTLDRLEELGFIAKPSWQGAIPYFERKLFLRVLSSDS